MSWLTHPLTAIAMAPEKKNEFLDASDSEEEQVQGYDSEDDLRKGGRTAKRRKLDASDDDLSDAEEDGGALLPDTEDDKAGDVEDDEETKEQEEDDRDASTVRSTRKKKAENAEPDLPDLARSLKKNLVATEAQIKKSGVVYLSRIPPFMKPAKLRSLLEPYGKINRIFLAPEDSAARARRVRAGGNKKSLYTEGWVEFVKKKEAKAACELLNAQTIGGKKGTYYRDDLWNLLYLNGFKWHNLTEQIAAENAERTSRMRAEISKTTKENKEFVRNVERAKMLDGIQAKTKKRKQSDTVEDGESSKNKSRSFAQTQLAKKDSGEEQPENVTRVLSKIF